MVMISFNITRNWKSLGQCILSIFNWCLKTVLGDFLYILGGVAKMAVIEIGHVSELSY